MPYVRHLALFASLVLLDAAALAQTDPLRPALDYGHTDRGPRTLTASAKPDQIRLSEALRKRIVSSRTGVKLGDIEALFLDAEGKVQLVRIDEGNAILPWSSLHFEARPTPHFTVDLDRQDLRNAPGGEQIRNLQNFMDLRDKKAIGATGEIIGTVIDVIASFGDGAVAALVIEKRKMLRPDEPHAVAWSVVKGRTDKGDLRVALTEADLANTPVLTTKAPEDPGGRFDAPVPQSGSTGKQPTLDTGGQPALGPAPQRR